MFLNDISFKRRIQILIIVSVVAVSIMLTIFYISQERTFAAERAERTSHSIEKTFRSIISDLEHYYVFRSRTIMDLPATKQLIKKRNTELLYAAVLPKYTAYRQENPYLKILQFHAWDGRSILRMHRKNEYGDDIASRRPMLRMVHRTKRMQAGFEGGIQGIAYRIVTPVFDGEHYIGAIEFGVDTNYIINKLKSNINTDTVMMIHQDRIAAADAKIFKQGIGAYRFTHKEDTKTALLKQFAAKNSEMAPRVITMNNQTYEINAIFLQDDSQKKIGAILCVQDITGSYQDLTETLFKSFLLTLTLIIVLLGFFEYAFGKLMTKIRFQDKYIRTILDSQKNIIIVSDGRKILFSNQAFLDYFHFKSLNEFKQKHNCICDFFEQSDSEHYLQPEIGNMTWTEYLVHHSDQEHKAMISLEGKTSIFSVHAQMMQFEEKVRYVVVFADITRLNELATMDTLTRIPNRFQFNKAFGYFVNMAKRTERPFSLILFDIDHFKQINDKYGHMAGDDVLKQLSTVVRENLRKTDILARWGGEEFVILLPETDLNSAVTLAESLRTEIENYTFLPEKTVTCSMGVVECNKSESEDELMTRADENLYLAKQRGRNRVVGIQ